MSGWIKLHRSLLEWEWYSDHNCLILLIHLLVKVNHEDKKWRGIVIKSGSMVLSWSTLSQECGLSVMQCRTAMDKLIDSGEVTRDVTNKYQVISLVKWDKLQGLDSDLTSNLTGKQQTNNKQITTTKEYKENKESKNIINTIVEYLNDVTGKKYQASTNKTVVLIKARLNEGRTLEDFKRVIKTKSKQWKGTENDKYLRPETLFGTKFEGYLNERVDNFGSSNGTKKITVDLKNRTL